MEIITPIRSTLFNTDHSAAMAGYTRHMLFAFDPAGGDTAILVKPFADLSAIVVGFDTDAQEWVQVIGWAGTWSEA